MAGPAAIAARAAATSPGARRLALWVIVGLALVPVLVICALLAVLVSLNTNPTVGAGGWPAEVPAVYVPMYQEASRAFDVNPFLLASIHAQESTFGQSNAAGIHSGVNYLGCCAGPMQFNLSDTWATYKNAYRHATRPDGDYPDRASRHPFVYDPFDAIMAAAQKLHSQGAGMDLQAPGVRRAMLAYNAADWYVSAVLTRAEQWQAQAAELATTPDAIGTPAGVHRVVAGSQWLSPVPGFAGLSCDQRIVPDLLYLIRRFRLTLTACYATSGHAEGGEHPLGLGADLVPNPLGSWTTVAQLAVWAEPTQNHPRAPFRWVGWNGDPGHGDPAHCACGTNAHLHLSWDHAPTAFGTQAAWVLRFTRPGDD
jgi:hypothetical protein